MLNVERFNGGLKLLPNSQLGEVTIFSNVVGDTTPIFFQHNLYNETIIYCA